MRTRILAAIVLAAASGLAAPGEPAPLPDLGFQPIGPAPALPAAAPGVLAAPPAPVNGVLPLSQAPQSPGELDRRLAELDRDERALKKRLADLGRESDIAHARAIARGRAYVRMARAGLLPVGGGFDELVNHAARLERLRRALARDQKHEADNARERTALGKKLDEVRARRGPIEAEQHSLARNRAALMAAVDREVAFQRAFSGSAQGGAAVYGSGVGPGDTPDLATGFAAARGRLPFPIPGRAEIRSVRRPNAEGPGLEMAAARGTVVRAVFTGRVAFSDAYAEYGNTVIVDHAGGHYTVSASLGSIDVATGDEVAAGTRLGSVGSSGSLYFEIRVGTDTVDPAEWFGL